MHTIKQATVQYIVLVMFYLDAFQYVFLLILFIGMSLRRVYFILLGL